MKISSGVSQPTIRTVRQRLRRCLGDNAILDGDALLCHALSVSRETLYARPETLLSQRQYAQLMGMADRRARGEPLAYLLGHKEFYGLELQVTPDVLIPRPETEMLIETALKLMPENAPATMLELGTGCGAVAIAMSAERRHCNILATDISVAALTVARQNARRHQATNIRFLKSDWYQALPKDDEQCFDLIVSNPPYVAIGDPDLATDVERYEPALALFAGDTGHDDLTRIIHDAPRYLSAGGYLVLEHGRDQADMTATLMRDAGLEYLRCVRDYSGHPRISMARHSRANLRV